MFLPSSDGGIKKGKVKEVDDNEKENILQIVPALLPPLSG